MKHTVRQDEDGYIWARCTCGHLFTAHDDDGKGACDWCRCGLYVPVVEPSTGEIREAS